VPELIALAKAQPGKVTVGNAGVGTGQDIAARQFSTMTGVNVLHVPYKGGAPALNDLLGGQIQAMFETSPTALPYAATASSSCARWRSPAPGARPCCPTCPPWPKPASPASIR
jgi:tripartite-type tricarboxylate transporter receptor subunit TctC